LEISIEYSFAQIEVDALISDGAVVAA